MPKSGKLEDLLWEVRNFVPDNMVESYEEFRESLRKANEGSILAQLPVGHIDLNPMQIDEYEYGEDYELGFTYYNSHTSTYLRTQDQVDDAIAALEGDISDLESEIEELEAKVLEYEEEDPELHEDSIKNLNDEISSLEEEKTDKEDELEAWEQYETESDEVYWNTIWSPGWQEVDETLAAELGFARIYFHDKGTYIGLQGCGMDLTPKLAAYCALKYGRVDAVWERYFRDAREFEYFRYVVGNEESKEVCRELGIYELAEQNGYFKEAT